ncbi:hypothetical protein BH18ACT13_BH18ACT13_01650 [soil metagenome]
MRGKVELVRGRWRLDERANFTSLVSQRVILDEMVAFLETRSPGRAAEPCSI